jgi:hypothetical protein
MRGADRQQQKGAALQAGAIPMHQTPTQDYFARRHRESVERADRATDPAIGKVHREFAQRYAAKLDGDMSPLRS